MTGTTAGTRSTGRRGLGRLVNSNGRMAIVGMLASAATIGFTLWIQYIMLRQMNAGEPLVRNSMELRRLLDRTFVELRGWIAYGDPEAKQARLSLWNEDIAAAIENLTKAARTLRAESVLQDVAELEDRLRRLRYFQWYVEDFAQSPSNVPARGRYQAELVKIGKNASYHLKVSTDATQQDRTVVGEAQALLGLFLELDSAVLYLMQSGDATRAAEVRRLATVAQTAARQTLARWKQKETTSSAVESLVVGAEEVDAFCHRVPELVALRVADGSNVSRMLYRTELKPLRTEVAKLAKKVSEEQLQFVRGEARGLFRWSFVVLFLALLMGAISLVALYVSYRLEDRVERALAKATSLGKYVIEERIGGGGMGEVFRARHALLRRPSAVKVLRLERALDFDAQERFQEEVQLTSQLTHPNTIAIFDYGQTKDGLFYYAMELLNGVTLRTLVEVSGPLPAGRVIHILRGVCASLAEAHAKGLLHRDIKPSNVMLTELGGVIDWVKVLDFGLVTHVQDRASDRAGNAVVGTPAYLAPEGIVADGRVGPRTDIYAIGAVGYFLLTGTNVFEGLDLREMLDAQVNQLPEPPSSRLGADHYPRTSS